MATKTIGFTHSANGVLTDATSAKLSDPTGTFGVKRNDTDAVVVADGTDFANASTGRYTYSFTEPAAGLSYTYWIELTYDGRTNHYERTIAGATGGGTGAVTFSELKQDVAYYLGYGMTSGDWSSDQLQIIERCVKRGLQRFYRPPPVDGQRYAHEWHFLRPSTTLSTVADTYLYDLPSDFAGLERPFNHSPGTSNLNMPIEERSEFEVSQRIAAVGESGRPRIYAIRPKAIDYTTGGRYEVLFDPTPDDAYTLQYSYRVATEDVGDTRPVPPGAQEHALTMVEACLAEAELFVQDTGERGRRGEHYARFMQQLKASISRDSRLASPSGLGYNRDGSDAARVLDFHDLTTDIVTLNGIAY